MRRSCFGHCPDQRLIWRLYEPFVVNRPCWSCSITRLIASTRLLATDLMAGPPRGPLERVRRRWRPRECASVALGIVPTDVGSGGCTSRSLSRGRGGGALHLPPRVVCRRIRWLGLREEGGSGLDSGGDLVKACNGCTRAPPHARGHEGCVWDYEQSLCACVNTRSLCMRVTVSQA